MCLDSRACGRHSESRAELLSGTMLGEPGAALCPSHRCPETSGFETVAAQG